MFVSLPKSKIMNTFILYKGVHRESFRLPSDVLEFPANLEQTVTIFFYTIESFISQRLI
jgi:hypothetical protein